MKKENVNKKETNIKESWQNFKERVDNVLRFVVLSVTMLMGFWLIYLMLLNTLGFTINNTTLWLLFGQSLISEWLYFKWVAN